MKGIMVRDLVFYHCYCCTAWCSA